MVVTVSAANGIAVVTINNPPVNATSHDVRQGLLDACEQTKADESVLAVVLTCAGGTFISGADIREFGKTPEEPHLPQVLSRIENAGKPWIAAIHGSALGGGLETALTCSHRIALKDAKLGLPEVNIGVIPGAGGTVRLPRLISPEKALEMIATGKPVQATEALEMGLIDVVCEGDLVEEAIALAKITVSEPRRQALVEREPLAMKSAESFEATAKRILARAGKQNSPPAAIQAVRNSLRMEPQQAMQSEREVFLTLRSDPQAAALRHIFFAERATTRIESIKSVQPKALGAIGVIGGGTMGCGIASACLLSGFSVIMVERDRDAAAIGRGRVIEILNNSLKRGLISPEEHADRLAGFKATDKFEYLDSADLVIEAVFEDMAIKREVFSKLENVVKPETILATNTSYLDINHMAENVKIPGRVIGLHFFSPAHIMKLLEIVTPDKLDNSVLATAVSFARKLGKIPVVAGVCDGFIANSIMARYRREGEYMLEDGAMPWDTDQAMTDFGFPMGLFQMQDLAGLDISWAMRKRQADTRDPGQRYVDIGDKICEQGHFGRKTGRGYYIYDENGKARPDKDVEALILAESARKGITRQPMSHDEIMSRILGVMQAKAKELVLGKIARSEDDIDVVMVNAFGFPRYRGGPMYMMRN